MKTPAQVLTLKIVLSLMFPHQEAGQKRNSPKIHAAQITSPSFALRR